VFFFFFFFFLYKKKEKLEKKVGTLGHSPTPTTTHTTHTVVFVYTKIISSLPFLAPLLPAEISLFRRGVAEPTPRIGAEFATARAHTLTMRLSIA
jgi:hypothetical protein